jgi:hypothetical protein
MIQAKGAEPPSLLRSLPFLVGRDQYGNWVVQEQNGVRGGLFVSRDAALRYVRSENEGRPPVVIVISGILELDMMRKPATSPYRKIVSDALPLRRVA